MYLLGIKARRDTLHRIGLLALCFISESFIIDKCKYNGYQKEISTAEYNLPFIAVLVHKTTTTHTQLNKEGKQEVKYWQVGLPVSVQTSGNGMLFSSVP